MGDEEWMSRLQKFAAVGVWPSEAGNRPSPRQRKWHDLYLKIEKCPVQLRGQMSLFGGTQTCSCGFHTTKPSSSVSSSVTPDGNTGADSNIWADGNTGTDSNIWADGNTGADSNIWADGNTGADSNIWADGNTGTDSNIWADGNTGADSNIWADGNTGANSNIWADGNTGADSNIWADGNTGADSNIWAAYTPQANFDYGIIYKATVRWASGCRFKAKLEFGQETCNQGSVSCRLLLYSSCPCDLCICHYHLFFATSAAPSAVDLSAHLTAPGSEPGWLPAKLMRTIPPQDQKWISSALWKDQRLRTDLKLWYDPSEPALIYHQAPTPERFFTHRLLLWMPYHLWKVRLSCPVCGKQLTGYGAHKRARHVLDVDRYYLMITETLWCSSAGCKTSYISTSKTILDQLDLAHRMEFRLILTQKYACDMRVIRFLRERTLGNSPSRLVRQVKENHSEEWLKRVCRYLGACSDFVAQPSCSLSSSRTLLSQWLFLPTVDALCLWARHLKQAGSHQS
ncbi:hypothetical protein QQF64_034539 [Cirrhinus molitorella]|uniref:DUF6729 domain-containing protein n=1 Tax=Cirrhinus molitorella TaxID=172907 RepID=A0ABR3L2A6_9TELE